MIMMLHHFSLADVSLSAYFDRFWNQKKKTQDRLRTSQSKSKIGDEMCVYLMPHWYPLIKRDMNAFVSDAIYYYTQWHTHTHTSHNFRYAVPQLGRRRATVKTIHKLTLRTKTDRVAHHATNGLNGRKCKEIWLRIFANAKKSDGIDDDDDVRPMVEMFGQQSVRHRMKYEQRKESDMIHIYRKYSMIFGYYRIG